MNILYLTEGHCLASAGRLGTLRKYNKNVAAFGTCKSRDERTHGLWGGEG